MLKSEFDKNRPIIWGMELSGLWHDIGKLSSIFLLYRQKWQKHEDGWNWNNDPHCNNFLTQYDRILHEKFPDLLSLFQKDFIKGYSFIIKNFTIKDAVNLHEKNPIDKNQVSENLKEGIKIIKAADSYDAAWDRNNPLFYADQTTGEVFKTNVYGKEYTEDKIDFAELDKKREQFYIELQKLLNTNSHTTLFSNLNCKLRREMLELTKKYFHKVTLSVTNRPDNDTSLWEHSYAVATLVKVILGHYLIYNELLVPNDDEYDKLGSFAKVRFGIFGVGWDGIKFMTGGQKVGDILGRKNIIDKIKKEIKEIVEYDYCLGNCIYEDDDGVYFLIPALLKNEKSNEYKQLIIDLKGKILEKSLDVTAGDLMPYFYPSFNSFDSDNDEEVRVSNTQYITNISRCIKKLREIVALPVLSPAHKKLIENLNSVWNDKKVENKTICPVCQRRPVIDEDKGICKTCLERRLGNTKDTLSDGFTSFTSEIVLASPKSKKLCLIVARFGLENWLNGKLIRTLFVKNAPIFENEINHLGEILDFANKEKKAKDWIDKNLIDKGYNYERIQKEINKCLLKDSDETTYANNIIFLYDRRNKFEVPPNLLNKWNKLIQSVIEEYNLNTEMPNILENVICAKTPTPSTILDVWMATQEFNQNLTELIKLNIPPQPRVILTGIELPENIKQKDVDFYSIYEGNIGGVSCEVVFIPKKNKTIDKILIINHSPTQEPQLEGIFNSIKMLNITKQDQKKIEFKVVYNKIEKELYYPFRIITQSPELFLAIVPADKAIEVSSEVYKKYLRDFGKVIGRLPFSLGNIFFNQHMPMFIVLDSARRLIKTFEEKGQNQVDAKVESVEKNGRIKIELSFPNQSLRPFHWELNHHLGDCNIDYHHPFFILGQTKDEHKNRKTYFPTIIGEVIHFSEIERCDTIKIYPNYYVFKLLDATSRRYELYESKANEKLLTYTLENIEQKFFSLWNFLKEKNISSTTLHNIEELILSKKNEWKVDLDNPDKIWEELVKVTIMRAFDYKLDEIQDNKNEEFQFIFNCMKSRLFFDFMELYLRILKRRLEED